MTAVRQAAQRRPKATTLVADPTRVITAPTTPDRPRPKGGPGTVINLGEVTKFEPTPEVRGKKWFEAALEMMQDPHVKRSVEAIVDPLLAAYWDFKSGDKTPLGREAADYARRDFFKCNNWEHIVRLGATGMVRLGVGYLKVGVR